MCEPESGEQHTTAIDPSLWETAAELVTREGEFTVATLQDFADVDAQSDDLEESFKALEELGWLNRTSESPPTWELGWKGQMFTNADAPTAGTSDKPV